MRILLLIILAMTPELSPSGVPQSAVDVLAGYYTAAADKLRELVLHPKGVSASSQAWNQARAAQQLAQIDSIMQQLAKAAADWIGPNLRQAMLDGIARGDAQMKAIGFDFSQQPVKASFNQIDTGTLSNLAIDTYHDLVTKAGKSMGENAKRALRKTSQTNISEAEVNRILAGGVISGQPADTIRELRDALAKVNGGKVAIIDKNGEARDFDAGDYSRMVVRTKTREATTAARHERLQQEGINLVSIVGRISANFCTGYLGMVFSLDGKSDKYPSIDDLPSDGPPFHPNCSKSTRPFVLDLATEKELDQADGVDGADELVSVSASVAQKIFQQKEMGNAVRKDYATTARQLFGTSVEK